MPTFLEFEGRTVEKAIEKASDKMNIPVDKIKHDVLSHGSTGIFGLVGVKKAKIRVLIPEDNRRKSIFGNGREDSDTKNFIRNKNAKEKALNLVNKTFGEIETEPEKKVSDQLIAEGEEALRKIITYITDDAQIETVRIKKGLQFNIAGSDCALLIGKRGQTLEAIQYLVEKIINKKNGERVRVVIDVEGYLESRKENLEKLANRLAEKAKKIGKPMTIGQMNSHDRRIVHLLLKNDNNVRTQSIGEGHYRKLMIFPKKKRRNQRKNGKKVH
jgi:spoIIIJ-associated protein